MRIHLFSSVALVALAHMSDTCETVSVNGGLRVNKSDYDADQGDGGAKQYKLDSAAKQEANVDNTAGVETTLPPGVTVPPAPSAPIPLAPDGTVPTAGIVTATTASPGQLLVSKGGTDKKPKFYVVTVDGGVSTPVVDREGIDKAGYDSEVEAWEAIRLVLRDSVR